MKAAVFVKYKNGLSLLEARKSKGNSQKNCLGLQVFLYPGFKDLRTLGGFRRIWQRRTPWGAALESLLYSSRDCGGDGCNKGKGAANRESGITKIKIPNTV